MYQSAWETGSVPTDGQKDLKVGTLEGPRRQAVGQRGIGIGVVIMTCFALMSYGGGGGDSRAVRAESAMRIVV